METTQDVPATDRGDMSSMAPLMTMLAEMQKELGDLRRKNRNGSSDTEDSDDGLGSDPLADSGTTFSNDELLARTHNGLLPTICHDPRFRRILDYRYYRLHKRSPRYDADFASRVAKWTRQLEASLKIRFDGSDTLAVLQFCILLWKLPILTGSRREQRFMCCAPFWTVLREKSLLLHELLRSRRLSIGYL